VLVLGTGAAWGKTSPGYKPVPGLNKVAPQALPTISIGTGKYPDLLVDGAGTAHIVYTQDGGGSAPDTLAFCELQRGIKSCARSGTAPNPQAPDASQGDAFLGNFPAGNHDFDGAVPLAIANQLYVVQRRFPDVFTDPDGTNSDSNVFEWSSSDGGATLTGPAIIGDNQMSGGAVAFGDPGALSIGTISRTQTEGTFFQGSEPGVYSGNAMVQLGSSDQAYDGSVAPDMSGQVIRPVAAFADLNGNTYIREWSGQGDVNDASTWSPATTLHGFSPRIVGGPAGVFLLTSDSLINGGNLTLRRIIGGQPSGASIALGRSTSQPAISEDSTGELSFAYTDQYGVEVRTSSDGTTFTPSQLAAAIPSGGSIAHLVTAATSDGGGFVSFVKNPVGAEGVGTVVAGAFGTQLASPHLGLDSLPGGGIGSAIGDKLATSTCSADKFGDVDAEITPRDSGCFVPDPLDPNMSVSLGTIDLNGLLIIPDQGTRIGIDPKLHKIQTSGSVRVVLRASGIPDITLYHGPLGYDVPQDGDGASLFDPYFNGLSASKVLGFPIDGDIDIKLAHGGVDIPVSLSLPKYLGGVTGSATLHASSFSGLSLSELNFTIGDANLGFLEIKNAKLKYASQGDVWSGMGELKIPSSGAGLDATISITFTNGQWTEGKLVVADPYPGVPLDDTDPPPQLFLTQQGFELKFLPNPSVTGFASLGAIPLLPYPNPKGDSGDRSQYAFYLDGQLGISFGSPVTVTLGATGYLFGIQIANANLVYGIPDQVRLNGTAHLDLDVVSFDGQINAIIDPRDDIYGGSISSTLTFEGGELRDALCKALTPCILPPIPNFKIPGPGLAIDKQGFAVYIEAPGIYGFYGTVSDDWGHFPDIHPYQDTTSDYKPAIPPAGSARATAATASFTVPAGAPTASLVVTGAGGPPAVTLTAPNGQQITPSPIGTSPGATVEEAADPSGNATNIGILHPQAGRWTVTQAGDSEIPVAGADYSIGVKPPTFRVRVSGTARKRVLHYHATLPAGITVRFAEETGRLLHVIGAAHSGSGAISFVPASGPGGRRQVVALISDNDLPRNQTVGSYIAPPPLRPGRARRLRLHAGRSAFSFRFTPPANSSQVLITIAATDGRHLQRTVSPTTHGGTVAALGSSDGVTVTVTGLGADGRRGPAVSARARRTIRTPKPKRHKKH
jgi:hypothetical protein